MGENPVQRQIARAAGTVMLAFLFSQLTGLVRSILVARAFGTQADLDAFLASNRVAETLFNLVAGGALGSAFIPAFTALLVRGDRRAAWRLASSIANLVLLVLVLLAILAALLARPIVRYALAPGFATDPAQEALTVDLLRIQVVSAVLFGLGGLAVGVLNSHQVFLIPALTPAMYQLGLIFGTLVLAPRWGIYGLAWGVVLGAAAYLLIQLPALVRKGARYWPVVELGDPNVREVFHLMGPRLLGVAVVQVNFWVNIWLASHMEAGSVSGVSYGFALMLMAQAAIAQSIATAAMPTLAGQYALGRLDEIRHALSATLRGVLLLSLPAAVGLILLRRPIVALVYQRGAFDAHSTELVAWALLWYALGLIGHSLLEVLARAFYALHDTRTPVLVGTAAMSLNVAFSVFFAALFRRLGWMPHGGLALANSLATALEAVALFLFMRRRLGGLDGYAIGRGLRAATLAAAGMAVVLWVWNRSLALRSTQIWFTLGAVLTGAGVYLLLLLLLRVPEIRGLVSLLRKGRNLRLERRL